MNIPHVVIVRWRKGHVAHVRYADGQNDVDLSHYNKIALYSLIEAHMELHK